MEVSGPGKSPNTTLAFRYNANNEELEELFDACDDDPPTPQCEPPSSALSENASPKRGDKTPSIIDKYFKSIRAEKPIEKEKDKLEDLKVSDSKTEKEEVRSSSAPKELSSSPMKEYLNRLGKRSTPEVTEVKEGSNETWKIFHDFKFKIAQAVEDMKTKSVEETKEKSVPRENSVSDSEDNSVVKDIDQQSVGDTDNQVSSLESSIQNLSEITQPVTAKAAEKELSLPLDSKNSESSDDTHKNLPHSDMAEDYISDSLMDVESGVEALEDNLDGFGDITNSRPLLQNENRTDTPRSHTPLTPANFGMPPSQTNLKEKAQDTSPRTHILNLTMYILTIIVIVNYTLFPNSNAWNGFLLGIWFLYLVGNVKNWFMETFFCDGEPQKGSFFQLKRNSAMSAVYTIPSVKEHKPLKKFEGWINHYRFTDYDPYTYHINKTTTAFVKLEGCNLRISYTRTKVAKRALWDEKIEKVAFYQHRLYNLTGARVLLLPKGLVKRRQWSKKYPICIILSDKEKIQVLEKENVAADRKLSEATVEKNKKEPQSQLETESAETNTSPEKKKKFIWRRKEKSVTHPETEPGKEGLRHRLVRKMHRDKKTDNVSTSTEPVGETQSLVHAQVPEKEKTIQFEDALQEEMELTTKSTTSKEEVEEDLDENEMSRLKEFLEESEMETGADSPLEGEWSVHVKTSKDKNTLYFFARTGRDKLEWFRRLTIAVSEAPSADSSAAEDKSGSEQAENKDGIELTVYRSEKDTTVSFAKNTNKTTDSISEGVTITSLSQTLPPDKENYEKNFWPYLLKILESKTPASDCNCRMLPAEVTWLNTALARIMFDVMRDPLLIARVQTRIQKKLHTLKLPSFMSPLVVTELSLSGACPLVERVLPPSCDSRGVWLDADLRYDGGAYIALLTQINLMKLKEKNMTLEDQLLVSATDENIVESPGLLSESLRKRKPAVYDSEMEDSAESSSDDETPPMQPVDSATNIPLSESSPSVNDSVSSKKKFLRMVDKIATNKYFQQVTDYKYVKRAMEGLSNTDIKLHLEIQGLEGRLALNLPPPPHDRLWVGFRTNPQLVLKAKPAVGARTLRFAHISNWIEQKLSKEFEKVLVLPNMEDIIIDVMTPTPVEYE